MKTYLIWRVARSHCTRCTAVCAYACVYECVCARTYYYYCSCCCCRVVDLSRFVIAAKRANWAVFCSAIVFPSFSCVFSSLNCWSFVYGWNNSRAPRLAVVTKVAILVAVIVSACGKAAFSLFILIFFLCFRYVIVGVAWLIYF